MQVLTWNLFHGRSRPGVNRDQFPIFAATIASWSWDVALLQEVPPWWPKPLAQRCAASMRMCLTSRNEPYLPRVLAGRLWPELVRSGMGGANAILVRGQAIADHRKQLLTRRPERRWVHGVRLADGSWAANLHASKADPEAIRDARRAVAAVRTWSGTATRVIVGGDWNVGEPDRYVEGFERYGGGGIDHVLGRGWRRVRASAPDAGPLSDHKPVLVELAEA